ncbi:MAG: HEPN domain-containing protein [Candidatus Ornithomonoglobus sp.]
MALYRLEKAEICLNDAKLLLENNSFMAAANRAYYAIFHSTRTILALDGEDRKKHSGVIAYFQQNYIKTAIFDKDCSYILQNAFEIRQEADYEDFYILSKDEARQQVDNAETFIEKIKAFISSL